MEVKQRSAITCRLLDTTLPWTVEQKPLGNSSASSECKRNVVCYQFKRRLNTVRSPSCSSVSEDPVKNGLGNILEDDTIVLTVAGIQHFTTKTILMRHSDYFTAMFNTDMKESKQEEIELSEIDSSALGSILAYCHHGELYLCPEQVHNILHAAHQFQIADIIEACEHFLIQLLHKENLLEILDLADHYNCIKLLQSVYRTIFLNLIEFSIKDTLISMKFEHFLPIFESNLSIKASEYEVFKLAKNWTAADLPSRHKHLPELLACIKFPLMSNNELSQMNRTAEVWLRQSQVFQDNMNSAIRYKNQLYAKPVSQTWQTICRAGQSTLVLFVQSDAILGPHSSLHAQTIAMSALQSANDNQDVRFQEHDLKLDWTRDSYATTSWNNFLFVAGGYSAEEDQSLSSVYRFDPALGTWQRIQSMQHKRGDFYLGVLDDFMYAVGGSIYSHGTHNLSSVEVYNCRQDAWTCVASLPNALSHHAGAVCQGLLYVSGGRTDTTLMADTNALLSYNASIDKWEHKTAMMSHRYSHGMVSVGHKLYVTGGMMYDSRNNHGRCAFTRNMECYDTKTDQWTALSPMTCRRAHHGMIAYESKMYVIGGLPYPGVDGRREILEYLLDNDEWQTSKIKYPTFWVTQCCLLKLPPSFFKT